MPREISDAAAVALPASYLSGSINVIALPALRLTRAGQNIQLAWPLWATNFTLQEANSLLPSSTWTNLSVIPSEINNERVVTLPISGNSKFYRLRQ